MSRVYKDPSECPYPTNRDIKSLDPAYIGLFQSYIKNLELTFPQFSVVVLDALRTKERQDWLYRYTKNTRTLHSNHLIGRALDIGLYRKADSENGPKGMVWKEETYHNVYTRLNPNLFGLESFGLLRGWDYVHLDTLHKERTYPSLAGKKGDVWLT